MRNKKGLLVNQVDEQSIVQVEKLSEVVAGLQAVCEKVSVEQIYKFLKSIFDHDMVVKEMQRRIGMNALQEVIVDENELHIFSDRFEKRTRQLVE